MKDVALRVNREAVRGTVEPRLHLADFLRGELGLTGTHLGCEQGVCGACTVIVDGKPIRSCIVFAVACDGADVVTIEGLDDDAVMGDLREAFAAEHGLQCGFCTPGMLIAARDLILRRGACEEAIIREELSGNLCRCTGYMGIVAAVKQASLGRTPQQETRPPASVETLSEPALARNEAVSKPAGTAAAPVAIGQTDGWTELTQRLPIAGDSEMAWRMLRDIPRVIACVPGAELEHLDGNAFRARMLVKLGPIRARFSGNGVVSYDEATRTGVLRGSGRDQGSGSNAVGEAQFTLTSAGANTMLDIKLRYRVTGMLAQFSRGVLVRDLVGHIAEMFGRNLVASVQEAPLPRDVPSLGILGLLWSVVRRRARALFGARGEAP